VSDPLLIDLFPGDGLFHLDRVHDAGMPWIGAVGKATQGIRFRYDNWFGWFWKTMHGFKRYGDDFARGAYHYLEFGPSGRSQADAFLSAIDKAGGWGRGDLWPVVDVERGGQDPQQLTRAIVEDTTHEFAGRVREVSGRPVILYGGELVRSLGITSRMGCELVHVARYTAELPKATYEQMGFSLDQLFAWQGVGVEGAGKVAAGWTLPRTSPGGNADISAVTVAGGGDAALQFIRERMFVTAPT
jgi:GH25 family lysozyme M1 (1,4-beta-N-acetylmuramidase)